MADGVTHAYYLRLGWMIILPIGIILSLCLFSFSIQYWYLYCIGIYFNYWLCNYQNPDDDLYVLTESESKIIHDARKINPILGLFAAIFVGYKIIYAYICSLFGGHRSWVSHGFPFGFIGRMIFYNIPVLIGLYNIVGYGMLNWEWKREDVWYNLFTDIWVLPFYITQGISWGIADLIHLVLDTKWSKEVLWRRK